MRALKASEVQHILTISYPTLVKLFRTGALRAIRIGNQWRVPEQELRRFLALREEEEEGAEPPQTA